MNKKTIIKMSLYIMVATLVLPVLIIVIWAFAKSWAWPKLLPTEWGLRSLNYIMDTNTSTFKILINSLMISLTVMVLTVMITIPAGKALAHYNFKGKMLAKMMLLAPLIVPSITVAMGIHVTFIRLSLANKVIGVVLMHMLVALPYGVRIFTNYFEMMGQELEESALNLGANKVQTLVYITIPMIAPAIVSAGSMIFIVSFSQYFLTFLIGGGRVITFPMVMIPFIQSGDRMMASMFSLVFIGSTLIVLFLFERILKVIYKGKSFYKA